MEKNDKKTLISFYSDTDNAVKRRAKFWHICFECTDFFYGRVNIGDGNTMCMGKCPVCKKHTALIPIVDYQRAIFNNKIWD